MEETSNRNSGIDTERTMQRVQEFGFSAKDAMAMIVEAQGNQEAFYLILQRDLLTRSLSNRTYTSDAETIKAQIGELTHQLYELQHPDAGN